MSIETRPSRYSTPEAVSAGRDTGDLVIGFLCGLIGGLIAIAILRFALSAERRADKLFAAWFGMGTAIVLSVALSAATG